jgi:hypothetical protein
MKTLLQILSCCVLVLTIVSCDTVTYVPKSKANIRRHAPSVLVLDKIIDFRVEQNSWPVSIADMTNKGLKYHNAFKDFPYTDTEFKVIDSNRMTFYFTGHVQDIDDYNTYNKINLRVYSGRARFYKEHGKFVWKLKMN